MTMPRRAKAVRRCSPVRLVGWRGDLLRRALGDDVAAAVAALGAEVDDVVGVEHDVEVVLDDDDRVAAVDEALQHGEQVAHVLEAEAGGRLVEDVERAAGGAARELGRELDALGLAAGDGRGGLAERDVAEADVLAASAAWCGPWGRR